MHDLERAVKAMLGGATALVAAVPDVWEGLLLVAIGLIAADTVTGFWLAVRRRVVRSRSFREQLVSKLMQYAIILVLGWGAHILAGHQEVLIAAALGLICYIEAMSLVENLAGLEACGGVPVKWMQPFLQRVGKYFELAGRLTDGQASVAAGGADGAGDAGREEVVGAAGVAHPEPVCGKRG